VPQWQAIVAENLSRISSNLSFLDVIGSAGAACFVVRFNGATIDTVYGGADPAAAGSMTSCRPSTATTGSSPIASRSGAVARYTPSTM
jgi:hypothetical protein